MGQSLHEKLRALRLYARHDGGALKALKEWAERHPASLAQWAHAHRSWLAGEIGAARRSAELELQRRPHDFDMLLICLDYHIRSRDSVQIYAYAKRLLGAKNPAASIRRMYAVLSILLWPLWLLGYKRGRELKGAAEKYDGWVEWAQYYVAKHANVIPERSGIAVTARTLSRHAWMTTSIDLSIDGNHVLTTGANSRSAKQTFTDKGKSHDAVLTLGRRSLRSIPYTLEIDGSLVEASQVRISNWWAGYWPFAATLALAVLWHFLRVPA